MQVATRRAQLLQVLHVENYLRKETQRTARLHRDVPFCLRSLVLLRKRTTRCVDVSTRSSGTTRRFINDKSCTVASLRNTTACSQSGRSCRSRRHDNLTRGALLQHRPIVIHAAHNSSSANPNPHLLAGPYPIYNVQKHSHKRRQYT